MIWGWESKRKCGWKQSKQTNRLDVMSMPTDGLNASRHFLKQPLIHDLHIRLGSSTEMPKVEEHEINPSKGQWDWQLLFNKLEQLPPPLTTFWRLYWQWFLLILQTRRLWKALVYHLVGRRSLGRSQSLGRQLSGHLQRRLVHWINPEVRTLRLRKWTDNGHTGTKIEG